MFAVIYRWKIKAGREIEFRDAWAERTGEIKKEYGTLGSRLHRSKDGRYWAYAQWPSRESWENASPKSGMMSSSAQIMSEATEEFEIIAELDVIADLLEPPRDIMALVEGDGHLESAAGTGEEAAERSTLS